VQLGARGHLVAHGAAVGLAFAAAYWQAVGQGFISDDFRWIVESRIRQPADLTRIFIDTTGFYRPVVSLVFGATDYAAGPNPRVFGVVTFTFALACAAVIAALARSMRLPAGAAVLAASLWLLNPHGINMAILWMSGLTALCLVLFSTLAAIAVRRGWTAAAVIFAFAALLSKEEAILLPLVLVSIAMLKQEPTRRPIWPLAAGLALAEAAYFALRSGSDALTPASAPAFYRFTFAPADLIANALQYADRALTLSAAVVLIAAAVVRSRPRLDQTEKSVVMVGAVWLIAGFGITLFLPVRSSLYALFPSVGAVLAASAFAAALWRQAGASQRRALRVIAIILPLLLAPVLHARTARWTELARVSRTTLEAAASSAVGRDKILFVDDRTRRDNLDNAFRSLFPDALQLFSGTRPEVWLVPPPPDAGAGQIEPVPHGVAVGWRYRAGRLEPVNPAEWAGTDGVRLR
jgi:hypothetical protein